METIIWGIVALMLIGIFIWFSILYKEENEEKKKKLLRNEYVRLNELPDWAKKSLDANLLPNEKIIESVNYIKFGEGKSVIVLTDKRIFDFTQRDVYSASYKDIRSANLDVGHKAGTSILSVNLYGTTRSFRVELNDIQEASHHGEQLIKYINSKRLL